MQWINWLKKRSCWFEANFHFGELDDVWIGRHQECIEMKQSMVMGVGGGSEDENGGAPDRTRCQGGASDRMRDEYGRRRNFDAQCNRSAPNSLSITFVSEDFVKRLVGSIVPCIIEQGCGFCCVPMVEASKCHSNSVWIQKPSRTPPLCCD